MLLSSLTVNVTPSIVVPVALPQIFFETEYSLPSANEMSHKASGIGVPVC